MSKAASRALEYPCTSSVRFTPRLAMRRAKASCCAMRWAISIVAGTSSSSGTTLLTMPIWRLRDAAGLTQEELAERAGLTAKGISDLERGRRRHPYPHTVRSLADALDLSEDEHTALVSSVPSRGGPAAIPE